MLARIITTHEKIVTINRSVPSTYRYAQWAIWREPGICRFSSSSSTPEEALTVSATRTSVSRRLWEKRACMANTRVGATKIQSSVVTKTPADSAQTIDILLSDCRIRDEYITSRGNVRVGKLLEDLDAFAGNIAFDHADDGDPNTVPLRLVTACVDRLDITSPIVADRNLQLCGAITWVGNSSMEITINLMESTSTISDETIDNIVWNPNPVLTSTFVFVSLTPDGKTSKVNQLHPTNNEERKLFEIGVKAQVSRKENRINDLRVTPPTSEEVAVLHSHMLNKAYSRNITLSKTKAQHVQVIQPQERNTAGAVFGGYLMRKALELAFANAHIFTAGLDPTSMSSPQLVAADDISFVKPVKIGSVVLYESHVVFTSSEEHEQGLFQIKTEARVQDCNDGIQEITSNIFHFTFAMIDAKTRSSSKIHMPKIIPETYEDMMSFIDGRRRFKESIQVAKSLNSRMI